MTITDKKLNDWAKKHDLKRLHKALLENDYKIRLKAIEHLGQLKNRESLPHLERLIDDVFVSVVKEAAKAIKSITPDQALLRSFEEKIKEKENLEVKRKERTEASFEPFIEMDEREKLEQMAKDHDVMKIYQKGLKEERKRVSSGRLGVSIVTIIGGIAWLLYYLLYAL